MRRIVLTFGLISGVVLSAMFLMTWPFLDKIGDAGALLGYATMVAVSPLVYFGVRRLRDESGGRIRFGRAFLAGMLIVCVSNTCYSAMWQVMYRNFAPDFYEKWGEKALAGARAKGASEAELAKQKADMDGYIKMYRNPVLNFALTFMEPMPVGLLAALI